LICAEVLKYYSALKDYSELIVTFGSVREEEEEIVLNAIDLVSANFKGVTFIAVPRYQERFLPFFYKLKQINSNTVLRSDNLVQSKTTVDDNKIVLVDKIGELLAAYQVSNLAFVGGTYSDVGGHNILEPAYFSVPIIIGPKMETQRLAYDALKKKEGIVIIEDHNQLGTQIVSLLENRQELLNKGVNAHSAYLELKGSSALILEKLQSFINK
jgi:3-deoxy-D-manno-octulosonic-acid transferase